VAVAQLVGETCHDHEQGPEANQSRALQEDFLEQLNQGDASQPYGSPLIELQGDAFEGSCSQIEPRKTPPPGLPSRLKGDAPDCREAVVTGQFQF
jgi:hypothetical protein